MGNKLDICCADNNDSMMMITDIDMFLAPSTHTSSLRRSQMLLQKYS